MVKLREILGGDSIEDSPKGNEVKENKRVHGKIIKVSDDGWGFISSKDLPFTRIFFHWTSLVQDTLKFKELKKGMKCEFEPRDIPEKGTRAYKIKILA